MPLIQEKESVRTALDIVFNWVQHPACSLIFVKDQL